MSAAADKARYYLEQSVPELKEFERKKLFTPDEIAAIAKKRSDFEHKINARGSSPIDYAQYAEFEINVDSLRKKRVKRLGIKINSHNGQRRIFFVFDRGTRKFPGDVQLWMQGIEYARGQKALKKVTQMLTNVLRLHPAKPELWIYAAQFALEENGDMTEARGYMQRALRFCKSKKELWLQDFRLELNWIAKIHARRRILGLEDGARQQEEIKIAGESEDIIALPKLTAEDLATADGDFEQVDTTALAKLDSASILTGAIPMAIFDAAMQQFSTDANLAHKFYEEAYLVDDEDASAFRSICSHINKILQENHPHSWHAIACSISLPLKGVNVADPMFPAALREALSRMASGLASSEQRDSLLEWCRGLIKGLLMTELDPALRRVLESKRLALGPIGEP